MEMNSKRICVLIGTSPFRSEKAAEAMRLSVGLTLRVPEVYLILVGDGLDALGAKGIEQDQEPSFKKHLECFTELGCPLVVEKEAMEARQGLHTDLGLDIWNRDDISSFLLECDGVIIVEN